MAIIEIKDLVKRFGDFIAVDNLSLKINEGEVFGLLGPNGAGKSTTISIICGLLNETSGEVKVMGATNAKEFYNIKKDIGLVPQNIAIYEKFTARENLSFFGELYGLSGRELKVAVDKALDYIGLSEYGNKVAGKFSGGMQRRLNIGCAIVHNPKLIIMDEPTVGIDPQSRNHILDTIRKLSKNGTTIIYTSHYMEEVEALCSKIAIMDHGKVIAEGSKEELKNMISDKKTLNIKVSLCKEEDIEGIEKLKGVLSAKLREDNLKITGEKDINNLDKIICFLNEKNIKIRDIDYKEVTLETVFLTLTGRSLRD